MAAQGALDVDALAPQPLPVLYSFRRCPYAMRARLALAASGLYCELREVVLRDKPPELLAASPKATVPVLVLPDGQVVAQSLEIMLWALRQRDPQGWLSPHGADLAAMQALIDHNDGAFKQHLDRYKYPNRYPQAHAGPDGAAQFAALHRDNASEWLVTLEARLHRLAPHAWLFGPAASLADMAILPFVRQFAHTDANWFSAQPWPCVAAWLARWEAGALFHQVMEKYPPWRPGSAGIEFAPITAPNEAHSPCFSSK